MTRSLMQLRYCAKENDRTIITIIRADTRKDERHLFRPLTGFIVVLMDRNGKEMAEVQIAFGGETTQQISYK